MHAVQHRAHDTRLIRFSDHEAALVFCQCHRLFNKNVKAATCGGDGTGGVRGIRSNNNDAVNLGSRSRDGMAGTGSLVSPRLRLCRRCKHMPMQHPISQQRHSHVPSSCSPPPQACSWWRALKRAQSSRPRTHRCRPMPSEFGHAPRALRAAFLSPACGWRHVFKTCLKHGMA